ncbi:hypothetical protein [Streptomyces globosus]|uniref:hypothetical protein n=1 Tax=Streptomyces globosus TaxID=68209 RepID=UPI003643CB7B
MNRFGKRAVVVFLALLVTGYILICRPPIHVVVSSEAGYALGSALASAAAGMYGMRRHRR